MGRGRADRRGDRGGLVVLPLIPVVRARALFDNDALRTTLNDILREKLNTYLPAGRKMGPDARVRFRDIDPVNIPSCARLKIIVSDARSGELVMFDHTKENVVIADAVVASAAIPFVFRSPEVAGDNRDGYPIYVDGGLVSNLPVWSFRAEKKALERAQGGAPIPVIAFSLNEAGPAPARSGKPGRPGFYTYLTSVIKTGIFGSQRVVEEFVADLITVGLPSPLKTLDFDCTREQATAAYNQGLTAARAAIAREDRVHAITAAILDDMLAWAKGYIAAAGQGGAASTPRLRMCVVDPIDDRGTAFRIVASAGMGDDADDRLELDGRNDLAPRAFSNRSAVCGQIRHRTARALMMTKYEHALVCRDVDEAICMPILPPGGGSAVPERVLCLDSSEPLRWLFNDSTFMSEFRSRSVAASRSLIASRFGS